MKEAARKPSPPEQETSVGQRIIDALRAEYEETAEEDLGLVKAMHSKRLETHRGRPSDKPSPDEQLLTGVVLGELSALMKAIDIARTVQAQSTDAVVRETES
jgi:hypothetical protein